MWTARRPPGGTGGCVPRRPVVNFLWPFRGGDFPRCPWQPWHSSFISISAGATLLPDSCVQVQLRAFEQLPIYTFEGPQQQGRPKSKASLSSLKVCVCVRARGRLGSVRSGRSSLRSRNRSEQPGSFRHGAGSLPRRRGGTSRRNVSSTASAKQYLLSLSLLLPSFWSRKTPRFQPPKLPRPL